MSFIIKKENAFIPSSHISFNLGNKEERKKKGDLMRYFSVEGF